MKHPGATNIHLKPTQKVGFVLKSHGFSGQLKIEIDNPEYTPKDFILLLINDKFVPFKIESFNPQANILKLFGFNSVESVENLVALPIVQFVETSDLQIELNLVGYQLHDLISNQSFPITNVIEMPGHKLIEFRFNYKDGLLPFHEDIIAEINHENRCVYANFPDGILDL